jgi:hypothetical protein
MGRKSREKWERRQRPAASETAEGVTGSRQETDADPVERRIRDLKARLSTMADGGFRESGILGNCPPDLEEAHLREVLAFESVESGTSLFEGLEEQGIKLPHPEKLNERASARKVSQILYALSELWIFLVGFERMSPREFYAKLFHETLWEGCYMKKTTGFTIIDVSGSLSGSDLLELPEALGKAGRIQ